MTPERFALVEQAFHRLSELEGSARLGAFEELREEDAELAAEVERLLEASDATWKLGKFGRGEASLQEESQAQGTDPQALPAEDTGSTTAPGGLGELTRSGEAEAIQLPERIGGFRVVSEIGRGGMGVVYLGERDDDFHLRAAIKLVKRGMDSDEILGRMRHERRILASLEHPNIARLIDGGTTEDGRPYFAMEYIEGRNLLDWASSERLDLEARIRLFLEICEAVEYAHRNLVIHRDLKPSNILVTEGGTAKLLDFGIAKLLVAEGEMRTSTGELMLTPDYASPEQILGAQLTTASDVYSLGVVLYELLAGVHPYRDQIQGLAGLFHFASNVTVTRASVRVLEKGGLPHMPVKSLARALSGDLDNILGMALRREPERRYSTVAELAEDLRRHLDLRPVRAHPETLGYRVGRFVRRQRLAVAAATLVFLSLSGGIAGTSWQAHQADVARQQAEAQAELASTVNSYLVDIFGEGDPGKHLGDEPTARDLVRMGRDRLDELESQPQVLAELAMVIGEVFQKLGEHKEAQAVYRRALEVRRELYPAPHPEQIDSLHLLADAEHKLGHFEEAEALLLEAQGQLDQLPADLETAALLLSELGSYYRSMGRHEEALSLLQRALDLRLELLGERHLDTAQTLNNLAVVYGDLEEPEKAAELMARALRITEQTLGPEHPESMIRRGNLVATLHTLGRSDEAVDVYRSLIETQRRVYGQAHHETGLSLNNLGYILRAIGRPEEAAESFEQAIEDLSPSLGRGHPTTLSAVIGRALAFMDAKQSDDSLATFEDFFSRAAERGDPPVRLLISAHSKRGQLLAELHGPDRAVSDLCTSLSLREQAGISPDKESEIEIRRLLGQARENDAVTSAECLERLERRGGAG